MFQRRVISFTDTSVTGELVNLFRDPLSARSQNEPLPELHVGDGVHITEALATLSNRRRDQSRGYADTRYSALPAPRIWPCPVWSQRHVIRDPIFPNKTLQTADLRAGAYGRFGAEASAATPRKAPPTSAVPVRWAKAARSRSPVPKYVVTKKLGARARSDAPQRATGAASSHEAPASRQSCPPPARPAAAKAVTLHPNVPQILKRC